MTIDSKSKFGALSESIFGIHDIKHISIVPSTEDDKINVLSWLLSCYSNIRKQRDRLKMFPYPFTALFNPSKERKESTIFHLLEHEKNYAVVMEYHGKIEEDAERARYFPYGDPSVYLRFLIYEANRFDLLHPLKKEFRAVLPVNLIPQEDLNRLLGENWILKPYDDPDKPNPQNVSVMSRNESDHSHDRHKLPDGFKFIDLTKEHESEVVKLMNQYKLNSFRPESLSNRNHIGVVHDGKIVSVGGVIRYAKPICIIGDGVTDKNYWRHGLGVALFQNLINSTRVPKYSDIIGDCNSESVGLLRKLGFQEIEKKLWCVHQKQSFI